MIPISIKKEAHTGTGGSIVLRPLKTVFRHGSSSSKCYLSKGTWHTTKYPKPGYPIKEENQDALVSNAYHSGPLEYLWWAQRLQLSDKGDEEHLSTEEKLIIMN